jgi:hypothetical protein
MAGQIAITLVRGPGSDLATRLVTHDGRSVATTLGAAGCAALACELLAEARGRVGRAAWPPTSKSPEGHGATAGGPLATDTEMVAPASPQSRWRPLAETVP